MRCLTWSLCCLLREAYRSQLPTFENWRVNCCFAQNCLSEQKASQVVPSELGKGNSKFCSSRRPHRISVNNLIVPFRWTNIESVGCFLRSSFVEHYLSKQLEKHLLAQPIVRGRRDIGWMVSVQVFEGFRYEAEKRWLMRAW